MCCCTTFGKLKVQICRKLHNKLKLVSCLVTKWKFLSEQILLLSQQLLEVSTVCSHACAKTLVNCIVNDTLVHAMPNVQQTLLQFVNVVQRRLINSLLDDAAYLVVDRIEVGAVRWPQTRGGREVKAGVACFKSRTVSRARCAGGALSCWKMKNSLARHIAHHGQQML